jgi:hypothetical protein
LLTVTTTDVEDVDDEGKDADKKDKKRLPALNIKKRKNSIDKKKLRMFSPRKLFDKDRGAKSSPDGMCPFWDVRSVSSHADAAGNVPV